MVKLTIFRFSKWLIAYSGLLIGAVLAEQVYSIQSIAGSNLVGGSGSARSASLAQAEGLAFGSNNSKIYIADAGDHRIHCVLPDGAIQTLAGTGSPGFSGDGGPAIKAQLRSPYGLSADAAGNLYVADIGNRRIRRISANGTITTVAGGGSIPTGPAGDGGPATLVNLLAPRNVLADNLGGFYFSDFDANRIYYVDRQGTIQTIASAPLRSPAGMAFDPRGGILVADSGNNLIRRLFANTVSTYAHSPNRPTPLYSPTDIAFDGLGNFYVADDRASTLVRSLNGDVIFIPVSGRSLGVDSKNSLYVASGGLVRMVAVADAKNNRAVSFFAGNGGYGFSGDEGAATNAHLFEPSGIAEDASGNIYIADERNHRVRRISPEGVITTFAGFGMSGYSGDGGLATEARMNRPRAVVADRFGYVYVAEAGNHTVRKINPSGFISTIAGDGNSGYRGDGGAATASRLHEPSALALNAKAELFIADAGNGAVRKINSLGQISTEAAGLALPQAITFDSNGALLIAESGGDRVMKLESNGRLNVAAAAENPRGLVANKDGSITVTEPGKHRIVRIAVDGFSVIAGTGAPGFDGDGGPARSAQLNNPTSLWSSADGGLLVADTANHHIRKLSGGQVSDIAAAPLVIFKAASNREGTLAPGELITIYSVEPLKSPTLWFDGLQAAVVYQSANQVNAVVPDEVMPKPTVNFELHDSGQVTKRQVEVAASAPALFTAAVNGDGRVNGPDNPAARASLITVFASGLGKYTSLSLSLGGRELVLSTDSLTSTGVTTTLFRVPAGYLAGGKQPLTVRVNEATSESVDLWIE